MNTPLVVIIPGLGNGGLNPEKSSTWPSWVSYLINDIANAVPDTEFLVGNYTDAALPHTIASRQQQLGCDQLIWIGHSDGGACCVWMQDHCRRLQEALTVDLFIALDVVTDFIRHGFLANLDPDRVRRAVRIYQKADPLIHSNPIYFRGSSRQVENMYIGDPPFSHPCDNHEDVAEDPTVHAFIARQVQQLAWQ